MKNQLYQASRLLNERPSFMGLEQEDLMAAMLSFLIGFIALAPFNLEVFGPILGVLTAVVLVPVRVKFRRRIIRDALRYSYIRYLRGGVIYDPANRRHD